MSVQPMITRVETATSSSDLVWQAAADGAPGGTGFLVAEQTAGRGRRGAGWSSARGGMYFSILLRPRIPSRDWFGLSFLAALAIRDELIACAPTADIALKWPNDVLANGGKLCGILLEARDGAVVIGTGVNIAPVSAVPGARLPAVALADFGAGDIRPEDLAESYAANLMKRVDRYQKSGFDPVRLEWLSHCAHIGSMMRITNGEDRIAGVFAGIGADGSLHLTAADGHHHIVTTGDVELIGN